MEELSEIIKDIQRDDQRAGSVILRMRSLLKKSQLQFQPVALETLADQVAGLLHSEFQASRAVLEILVAPDLPLVNGDIIHLQQVLLNLISNALDAVRNLPVERRRLELSLYRPEPNCVEVRIVDQGPGIPEDQQRDRRTGDGPCHLQDHH